MDEIKLYILKMDEMSGGSMNEIKLYILRMDEMIGGVWMRLNCIY